MTRRPTRSTLFPYTTLFRSSQQRSRFATSLQAEARKLEEEKPETSSSATGALHRGWINLKSAITGGDEHADRKSTRLNSSHRTISYAVFCLKKKTTCIHFLR